MSKLVMLNASIAASHIVEDLFKKVAAQNPALADAIVGMEVHGIIHECVQGALKVLESRGMETTDYIADYFGSKKRKHGGMEIIGALKTASLPRCMGVMLEKDGTIKFAADDYKTTWKTEIKRLQGLFRDAFLYEVGKASLVILGYPIESENVGKNLEDGFNVTGVKFNNNELPVSSVGATVDVEGV